MEELAAQLRSCGRTRDLAHARALHNRIRHSKHRNSRFLANLVVEMYGRCGSTADALAAFQSIDKPNSFSWNIVIAAFAHNGQIDTARALFDQMPERERSQDPISWNCLITAYGERDRPGEARELFDQMPSRDTISWNAMLAAYAQQGNLDESKLLFDRMPNKDIISWNTLISTYGRTGQLEMAQATFDAMAVRNSVTWNSLLAAYAQTGHLHKAESLLDSMPGHLRDAVTTTIMLSKFSTHLHTTTLSPGTPCLELTPKTATFTKLCFSSKKFPPRTLSPGT
ncbi:pentatricopeptide repeat-containing protein At2g35030, mitochondrial-like [Selaginella moellendorffii]|uniref:pentatricopeptide repeat-containing protein At2g35030, mitochondrial-like n=1 Tax=Selaginella moellendorffii TaxID=88036 RepID=UPI000D1CA256|nr:pentatricopeptide repeat-containing protein At2g35030, mitochondrial-like [Selaginella moellendorffii]|eukprot:XP_024531907.1 pentatricopeptide repeat-containing protein At2g35030, mitochondrial-like [Selaginella moellendorffii]